VMLLGIILLYSLKTEERHSRAFYVLGIHKDESIASGV